MKRIFTPFGGILALFLLPFFSAVFAQDNLVYQAPPASIRELVDAPTTPSVLFTKNRDKMLLLERPDFPTIVDVSQPVLGLAGIRLNPANNAAEGAGFTGITVKDVKSGQESPITGLPPEARIGNVAISPDEKWVAFSNSTKTGVELWIADMQQFSARKLTEAPLNDAFGATLLWTPSGTHILAKFIPDGRGEAPKASDVPTGPVVQESLGKTAPSRTYQNLLENPHDEALFDYYMTAQLGLVDLQGGITNLGAPAVYRSLNYSPDGNYLLVQRTEHPYSYLVPVFSFPYHVLVWDSKGNEVKKFYEAPLADNVPIGFDNVSPGPRGYSWRPDKAATLYWVEALDGGLARKSADKRDAVYQLDAPFTAQPTNLISTTLRFGGITWADKEYAILSERWRQSRAEKMTLFDSNNGDTIKTITNRSSEDTYTDPGRFVYAPNAYDRSVLLLDKGKQPTVFTISEGASPEGDRPFLMRWNLISGKTDTLFRSQAPYYESPVFFDNTGTLIVSRESVEEPPNYYAVNLKDRALTAITAFPHPYPSLKGVQKQQLSYPRNDGLTLTGTLYLPKGYKKEDGPLPMLMWAYPREFKTAAAASQIKGSPYRFTRIAWGSPIYWVTRGYAVLDNADMPIVGEGDDEPNDTFVPQVQANAKAAIDYVASLGVADPKRIGVGGHSYGAFMTANLLAHTNLFAAGIARSGAYNRTLTPFGFQAEPRTYWEAPEVYYQMSPFSFADKIKTPILLIHGMDDDNSGTFPINSERLYAAIKGHGGTIRLVFLPKELHGYRAKESVFHTLWEMDQWLEKYVKNKAD
ncbi:S9 family peptidase [Parapedobacter koreensis]|uniref:Glutamyl peptidase. Serine peptidase. MEROPS family S09D n=1 Tax=Parapedobacter koreensis TaxID=332977 RepID=A0A1H7EZM6_9SPHI|nr:prolyl oligopeptidase family serine peptidase [Parapedobacter koreensis]SEK18567.1 glutamyl peptidase. Serine peptidase. MEROPS family S09D [Parapedobacter koreensis]